MELLLFAGGTYLGIMAGVWLINAAFTDGGVLGILGIFAAIIAGLWIGKATEDDSKK